MLEEGQRERWFESQMIVTLSLVSLAGMILIALSQIFAKRPIMRLSLMRNPRYASVIVIVSAVGAGLYGVSYLLPQFLAIVAGYNAEQAGAIMLLSGQPAFLVMPILPRLLGKVDFRILVISGLLLFCLSCMLDISLTAQSVGHDFVWSQLIRGVAQMLAMMPLNQASMAAVAREDSGDAAAYNMARNLGGSISRDHRHRDRPAHDLPYGRAARIGDGELADRAGPAVRLRGQLVLAHRRPRVFKHARARTVGPADPDPYRRDDLFRNLLPAGPRAACCVPLALLLRTPRGPQPMSSGH